MATDAWQPASEDIDAVRAFLGGPLCATPQGSACWAPALEQVLITHIEDGFVHLAFIGWPVHAAQAVADQLLHPDALLVSRGDVVGTFAPAFEGFGWHDQPPPAVLAHRGRPPHPPSPRQARSIPDPPVVDQVTTSTRPPRRPASPR